jgi:hypothetical protein
MAEQEIVIRPPGKEKPGYLRRVRRAMDIQKRMADEGSVEAFDDMIDFIVTESDVSVPDGVDPKDALLDLSQEEYDSIFSSFTGASQGVDPQSDA